MALLAHALPARARPAQAMAAANRAAAQAVTLAGPRGEAREAARAILEAVREPPGGA
jgi:sugar/nucleoside kinase (ribokinase family)